jgi:hypothetical protein
VTWIAGETLDVYYELRKYVWLDDVPYEDTIGGGTYTGVVRASRIADGAMLVSTRMWTTQVFYDSNYPYDHYGATGAIGAITAIPAGSKVYPSVSNNSYVSSSYKRTGVVTFSPTVANTFLSWNMGSTVCSYQKSISPGFVKSTDFTLVINAESGTWGRYVP